MKKILFIAIVAILAIVSCNQSSKMKKEENQVENNYSTPAQAFDYAKANLHLILNESQMRSYGLGSKEEIMKMVTTNDIPLIQLPMDKLKDSTIVPASDARIYALGEEKTPRICITVRNPTGKFWIISTIGLKKYASALASHQDVTAIIEVLGLEINLLELQSSDAKIYKPITDYPEANIYEGQTYKATEVLRSLEAYRAELEKKFGKEFSSGLLER